MPTQPFLPEDVVEVASISISVGLGKHGQGCAYEYEGLSPEAALGYVEAVADQLREEIKWRWACGDDDLVEDEEDDE